MLQRSVTQSVAALDRVAVPHRLAFSLPNQPIRLHARQLPPLLPLRLSQCPRKPRTVCPARRSPGLYFPQAFEYQVVEVVAAA
jgi:hypothetical protein